MRRSSKVGTVAVAAAALAVTLPAAPAAALVDGVQVRVEGAQQLRAGAAASALTAVATRNQGSAFDCRQVRWVLDATGAGGFAVDDLQVTREENGTAVPLTRDRAGARLRLVDQRADEGLLCRGRTVTARYGLATDESADNGTVDLAVTAFDSTGQALATGSLRVAVRSADPTPTQSPDDDTGATPGDATDDGGAGAPPPTAGDSTGPAVPVSTSTDVPVAGFTVGGLLLLLGVALGATLYRRRRSGVPAVPAGRHEPRSRVTALFPLATERLGGYRGAGGGKAPGSAGRMPGAGRRVGGAAAGWTRPRGARRP
ncbi:MAG TPA: hypothetical protein VFY17_04130 [Pilimelia sp.]|nr:hypothetical protein [Pilimelia sp.]